MYILPVYILPEGLVLKRKKSKKLKNLKKIKEKRDICGRRDEIGGLQKELVLKVALLPRP